MLNHSICAGSDTNTKNIYIQTKTRYQMSCVTCHLSPVTSNLSPVTCHLSPTTWHMSLTPTTTATDPSPANSPTMHSRMVHKDPYELIFHAHIEENGSYPFCFIKKSIFSSLIGEIWMLRLLTLQYSLAKLQFSKLVNF